MEFSDKVRNRLGKLGRSQTDLATAIGTTQQQVSEWLQKNRPPKWSFLLPMARFLGVTCDYLLDPTVDEPQDVGLPEDERMIVVLYRSLKGSLDRQGAMRALALAADRGAGPGEYRDVSDYVENRHISPSPPPRKGRKPGEQAG